MTNVSHIVAIFVCGCGLLVAFAWITGHTWWASLGDNLASMKFSTAICFVSAGLMFSTESLGVRRCLGALIVAVMAGAFTAPLDPWAVSGQPYTVTPGVPSLMTAFSFMGLVYMAHNPGLERIAGLALCAVSLSAVTGCLLGIPALFFYLPGFSTGMSLPTAVLFGVLGLDIALLKGREA